MVEAHLFMFENLWKKGIPAEDRIKEIEEGIQPSFTETVRDPLEIDKIGFDLVNSAKEEIQMVFSTANTFSNQEGAAGNPSLLKLISDKLENEDNLEVRILLPAGKNNIDLATILRKRLKERDDKIAVQYVDLGLQKTFSTLIVDKKYLLVVEYKDDANNDKCKSIEIATYSNSEATIMSYTSIFDSLWIQSELQLHHVTREAKSRLSPAYKGSYRKNSCDITYL